MSLFGKSINKIFDRAKFLQHYSTTIRDKHFQVVVLGGGTGGASISNALGRKLGRNRVAVVEPSEIHYYQGTWTLIGAGAKPFHQCHKATSEILTDSTWLTDSAQDFSPESNLIRLKSGEEIKGLPEAFSTPGVCSSYHQDYVRKTFQSIQNFRSGNAIFTYPQTTVKCPGAAQKTMYLAEDFFRKNGKRDRANVMYCTPTNFMFGVKAYNKPLEDICDKRGIIRNYGHTLVEIKPPDREAIFDVKNVEGKIVEKKIIKYEMIHVTPPCFSPDVLRNKKSLIDEAGFLNVQQDTLQHATFPNIFGIGDCTNVPTSKTAAAAAVESGVLQTNVVDFLQGRPLTSKFNGYASCPLVTGYGRGIMPEFDYSMTPWETFPFLDQSKERRLFYFIKADLLPILYWRGLVSVHASAVTVAADRKRIPVQDPSSKPQGRFNGPQRFRKWLRLGFD